MALKLILSSLDVEILNAVYWVDDPRTLPNRVEKRMPADFEISAVEALYDLDLPRGSWTDCTACGTSRNHEHGFVVVSTDGRRATIGQTCADKKHHLEYAAYLADFGTRLKDRNRPEGGFVQGACPDGGMPPPARNHRAPTAGDTPATVAASSLERPAEIAAQNRFRSSCRATGGRPGDRKAPRPARSDFRF